jgi:hypothetical protein
VITWVIDNFSEINGFQLLATAIKKSGQSCLVIGDTDEQIRPSSPIIYHGSFELIEKLKLTEGDFCWKTNNRFDFSSYSKSLSPYLLNHEFQIMSLSKFKKTAQEIISQTGSCFIRPDGGYKSFSGSLIKMETLERDLKNLFFYEPQLDSRCIISSEKQIQREWRMVAVSGKIVTGSLYKNKGKWDLKNEYPDAVLDLAGKVATIYQPDDIFMIDITEFNGQYYLLELNNFSTSALYRSDMDKIVNSVKNLINKSKSD